MKLSRGFVETSRGSFVISSRRGELVSRTVDGFGVRDAASDDRMGARLGKPAPEPTFLAFGPRRLQAAEAGRCFAKKA